MHFVASSSCQMLHLVRRGIRRRVSKFNYQVKYLHGAFYWHSKSIMITITKSSKLRAAINYFYCPSIDTSSASKDRNRKKIEVICRTAEYLHSANTLILEQTSRSYHLLVLSVHRYLKRNKRQKSEKDRSNCRTAILLSLPKWGVSRV